MRFDSHHVSPLVLSSAVDYVTTFTGNDFASGWRRGLTEGLDWSDPATGLASDGTTRVAYGTQTPHTSPPYDDTIACLSGYKASHYAQGTVYNDGGIVGLPEVELLVLWTISGNIARGYEVDMISDGRVDLTRWNGAQNDFTIVVAPTTTNVSIANNAVWRVEASGGTITCKCNGNVCFTYDYSGDGSQFQTGNPGLGFFADAQNSSPDQKTQANRHFNWKAFSAGNL